MPLLPPHRRLSTAKIAALALLLVLLQACSAVKVAYGQAPALLSWQLDSYLDLSSLQKARLAGDMDQLHAWHRKTQLPLYAEFLAKNRPRFAQDWSKAQACTAFSEAKTQLQPALDQLESVGSWLLPDLSKKQLAYLENKLADSNAKWRDEWLDVSAEALLKTRYKQLLSRSEFLYGDLAAEQKKAIRSLLEKSSFDARKSYALRIARQTEFLELVRQASPATAEADRLKAQALVQSLLARDAQTTTPYQADLRDEGCALFADIHNLTTPAQRLRAVSTLKAYEEDLLALAVRG
ncbi:DUF6279 family lipoprotein [Rhodoferax lacus]|uniref:DUF6279 family lipoprotein n=1 Tax=Rhodoferax lacus TaxID=2184758 RepID=UPI0011C1BBC4|nr:DUF6279 family lipoprotein [Rhodoferax lacus]